MTEKIEKMLKDVEEISNKYKTIAQATGGNFNIFEIVNISHKEVYMCRLLSELLNPNGSHYQGNIYLKLFFETMKRNYGDKFNLETPENAEVLREEGIEGCRRIDITIDDGKQYLPIEVKIYAQDQKEQCKDYLKKAKDKYGQGENARLCYLTIEGHLPDESSLGDMSEAEKGQIIEISWRKDIIEWLDTCIKHQNTVVKAPIREILIQFKRAVQKFTNQLEENEEMEIQDLISKSEQNFESAEKIYLKFLETKRTMVEKFRNKLLEKLSKKLAKNPDEPEENYTKDALKDWNIGYKLKDLKDNRIEVARISYVQNNDTIQKLYQELCTDWSGNGGVKTLDETQFKLSELNSETLDYKVEECSDWIIKQLEK